MDLRISPFPADTQLRKREFAFLRNEKFKKKTNPTQRKKKKSKTQTSLAETTRQEFLIFFFKDAENGTGLPKHSSARLEGAAKAAHCPKSAVFSLFLCSGSTKRGERVVQLHGNPDHRHKTKAKSTKASVAGAAGKGIS